MQRQSIFPTHLPFQKHSRIHCRLDGGELHQSLEDSILVKRDAFEHVTIGLADGMNVLECDRHAGVQDGDDENAIRILLGIVWNKTAGVMHLQWRLLLGVLLKMMLLRWLLNILLLCCRNGGRGC